MEPILKFAVDTMEFQERAWTTEEYERLREAASKVIRSRMSFQIPGGVVHVVDGNALWELMGAFDRSKDPD